MNRLFKTTTLAAFLALSSAASANTLAHRYIGGYSSGSDYVSVGTSYGRFTTICVDTRRNTDGRKFVAFSIDLDLTFGNGGRQSMSFGSGGCARVQDANGHPGVGRYIDSISIRYDHNGSASGEYRVYGY